MLNKEEYAIKHVLRDVMNWKMFLSRPLQEKTEILRTANAENDLILILISTEIVFTEDSY